MKGVEAVQDEELIKRIKRGHTECANELIARHYCAILRYCARHCTNSARAEDLAQETFLRVFRDFSQYDDCGKFRAYLYTIAYRLCVDESRKPEIYALDEEVVDSTDYSAEIENRAEVERLLKRLSPSRREAIIIRFSEQLSFREISQITGIPLRTIQSRVRLALEIMRKEKP
jgi:RNA polymerase sigma-70 factor (ECF subfamily)